MSSPLEHQDENLSYVHSVRPEGRVHEMGAAEKAAYLWKYFFSPRTRSTPAIEQHFAEQKRLQAYLSANDEVTPAGGARLGFLGDIMWLRSGWGGFLAPETLERLRRFDALLGNLESPISPRFPVVERWPDLFTYNSDPRLVTSFQNEDGSPLFGALSLANNHVLDQGDQGARDTMAFLASHGIPVSGASEPGGPEWCEFQREGLRFGFYAAGFGLNDHLLARRSALQLNFLPGLAPERPGVEPDLGAACRALKAMDAAGVHVKIIYLHWGFEYEFYPSAGMMRTARTLVAAGADFLFGSHPHILQPMEVLFVNGFEEEYPEEARAALPSLRREGHSLLQGVPGPARPACILYSLGNFATAMYTFYCRVGALAGVKFYRDRNGRLRWTLPELEMVYNVPPGPERVREILPIERAPLHGSSLRKKEVLERHLFLKDAVERATLAELPRLAP
jgi:Bacterial capsule synthesis protein PGA_cap